MKVVIFGLGSIGIRHAKILLERGGHEVYAFRSEKGKANDLGIMELYDWDQVRELSPDVAMITNPTFLHIDTATRCTRELGCALFIEKPIGMETKGLDNLLKIVKEKDLTTYVAYNLRFHPVLTALKKKVEKKKPLHLQIVCTSYLPDWRLGTDHLAGYSANRQMGGGVILDLSHEIDYASWLMGGTDKLNGKFSRSSDVTVDAEDTADILLEKDRVGANIHIDFMSHKNQRTIRVDFGDETVVVDLRNATIETYKGGKISKTQKFDFDVADPYFAQLDYFFKNIKNSKMMNNIVDASLLFEKISDFRNK